MIRCPNFRSDKARDDFNGVLERLGGVAMSADDVSPRQPYLSKLNEKQTEAYHVAHYLWNAFKTPAEMVEYVDALDAVRKALAEKPVDLKGNKKPSATVTEKDETAQAPAEAPAEAAPLSNIPAVTLARSLVSRLRNGKPITAQILQAEAAEAYGGKLSEGRFDRKDMQDALELAVNMFIRDSRELHIIGDDWREPMQKLDALV